MADMDFRASRAEPLMHVAELAGTILRCPIFSSIVIAANNVSMCPMLLPWLEVGRIASDPMVS